jgi:hypothetical protein
MSSRFDRFAFLSLGQRAGFAGSRRFYRRAVAAAPVKPVAAAKGRKCPGYSSQAGVAKLVIRA